MTAVPLAPSPTQPPSTPRRRLWLGILLAVGMVFALIVISAPRPQGGSTYGRGPTGYRAWYEAALQQGVTVQRWQRPYDQLAGTGQTLLQVWGESPVNPPTGVTETDLRAWVEAGNTLIRFTWAGQVTAAPFRRQISSAAGAVQIETRRRLVPRSEQARQQRELQDAYGAVVWSEPLGRGRIVHATYPWLAANIYADQPGNFRFLTQLAQQQSGSLWVDEWIHGHRDPTPDAGVASPGPPPTVWDYLVQTPLVVVAAQGVVLLVLLLWGGNHRFGQVWLPVAATPNNSQAYVESLAATLNAAGHRAFVATQLQDWLRQQLATQLGLTALGAERWVLPDDSALAEAWSRATGRSPQDLLDFLQPPRPPRRLGDRDLLAWVDRAESLLRGLS